MLQQTQVATVIDYFKRFMKRFPDVQTLASADEQDVLKLWAGLGYYRRARQLHAAAKEVVERFDGTFPDSQDDILSLPGIGRYTAGAIASIAFEKQAPILEANTIRLFSRLLALREDTALGRTQRTLWEFAENLVKQSSEPGCLNQAAMELGSQICQPQQPNCLHCPLSSSCRAHKQGLQDQIPVVKPRPKAVDEDHVLVIIVRRNKCLMRMNPPGQWWEGLWDFPRVRVTSANPIKKPAANQQLVRYESVFEQQLGLNCSLGEYATSIKHAVTRFRISLHCFHATWDSGQTLKQMPGRWRWVPISDQDLVPLTATAKQVQQFLDKAVG